MDYKELADELYTGGHNTIGFVLMEDMRKFDSTHGITRRTVHEYPTSYSIRDSNVLSMSSDDVDFGYKVETIQASISIFKSLGVIDRDVLFHFPDKNAPLVLTDISSSQSTRIGAEWGILICSCDVEPEEST